MKKSFLVTTILWLGCFAVHSQTVETMQQTIDYRTYIGWVRQQNLGYAAEKLNVSVAEAEVKAARIFNDPAISVEYADNDDRRMQMGRSVSVELSRTFSLGKRSAGMDLAKSEKALAEAMLEDYFHTLRAEASLAYLETIKQSELYRVKESSYESIRRLAESDSIKYTLGKITYTDAVQSKLEAGMAYNDLMQAQTELYNSYASLGLWTGVFSHDTLYCPVGRLKMNNRAFDTGQLLQTALTNRSDLAAAMKNTEVAQKALKVVKRERNPDIDWAVGYNFNTEVRNEIAPAPKFNGITVGLSVPLKFSSLNRGAVRAAEYRMQQAEINYRQAELEVQTSVMQSLRRYLSLQEQVKQYDEGLLENAKLVIEGKIYSYDRGETSLLEVLDAQRTYDELHASYIETLFSCAAALIELERNAGIWDIIVE
ncbi:Cobalt-zinc-cadmium resistance protein CzcC [termite gut metagenome]|uniref:Cobalt-zinc-cadmium resistance protein CzcC n=1 Tax=termite gut metagenome TaxID=433724 RepID=A0A5J4QYY7_9ZZZZ